MIKVATKATENKSQLFPASQNPLQPSPLLTRQPHDKEDLQHEESIMIHNNSGHHRNQRQSQILHSLTTEKTKVQI